MEAVLFFLASISCSFFALCSLFQLSFSCYIKRFSYCSNSFKTARFCASCYSLNVALSLFILVCVIIYLIPSSFYICNPLLEDLRSYGMWTCSKISSFVQKFTICRLASADLSRSALFYSLYFSLNSSMRFWEISLYLFASWVFSRFSFKMSLCCSVRSLLISSLSLRDCWPFSF